MKSGYRQIRVAGAIISLAIAAAFAACGAETIPVDESTLAATSVGRASPSVGIPTNTGNARQPSATKPQPPATPNGPAKPNITPTVGSTAASGPPDVCPSTALACRTADAFARYLRYSDFDSMFLSVEATPTICPGSGGAGIEAGQPLCSGATAGQLRNGFPIMLHGSEGLTVSGAELPARVRTFVGDPTRLRLTAIGCDVSPDCDQFVVVFATGGVPQVIYFAFTARPIPGVPLSARLSGFGLSGDNAGDILALKPTWMGIGPTSFVAYTGAP